MSALRERLLAIAESQGGPLLALDTSGAGASVCRVGWRPGEVDEQYLNASVQQTEAIGKALADAAAETRLKMSDLRAIVVGIGPGSFTGLRVGLAMAKGVAYAAHVPIYAVSSLAMLAASQGATDAVVPERVALSLEARRGEIYAAVYDVGTTASSIIADALTTPAAFAEVLRSLGSVTLVGDVPVGDYPLAQPRPLRAAHGIVLAAERLRAGAADDLASLVPTYLKVSEAERTTP